jgi:transcriptional regulator with XRE-family HTH domain
MVIDSTKFAAARKASGLTLESAASACGITRQTYQLREKRAGDFHLSELLGLRDAMDDSGRKLLQDALYDLFF